MSSHRLATRYAKSLIQRAEEKGLLSEVYKDIQTTDAIFEGSRDLKLMFKSPIIPADKKLAVVKKLFESRVHELLFRFMTLMIKKGWESHFHDMVSAFIVQYNVIKGITPVTIISAVKLDAGLVQSILASLKKKENLKEVELVEVIDETLIAGFVLKYEDKMIDNSVRKNLSSLRNIIEDDSYIKRYS